MFGFELYIVESWSCCPDGRLHRSKRRLGPRQVPRDQCATCLALLQNLMMHIKHMEHPSFNLNKGQAQLPLALLPPVPCA